VIHPMQPVKQFLQQEAAVEYVQQKKRVKWNSIEFVF